MLAQNFKTATDLGITENELSALITVLGMLERGELKHVIDYDLRKNQIGPLTGHFNMLEWNVSASCGTVCCIGGTAELIMGREFENEPPELHKLFFPNINSTYRNITVEQAAIALRSYLTTGNSNWRKAVDK
jgi:hypothetical protein